MEKLGIVFYGRAKSALLVLFCIWIAFFTVTFFQQAFIAYFAGDGFDTPSGVFLVITWCLFLPYLLVSGVILRSITARLSFHNFVKKQIVVPEYSPPSVLSPAEAGLLLDNEFHMSELSATIMDLNQRGHLTLDGATIRKTKANTKDLTAIEREFIDEIFGKNTEFIVNLSGANTLLEAGQNLSEHTRQKLVSENQLNNRGPAYNSYRQILNVFIVIALFVQAFLTIAFISSPSEVMSINYPRYPMTAIEPISVVVVLAIFLIVSISGLWQKAISKDKGVIKWRYVAGLRVFIDVVYKGRFYDGDRLTVTEKELKTFYPYALALGVENEFTQELEDYMLN